MPKVLEYTPPPESGLTLWKAKVTMRRSFIEVIVTDPFGKTSEWEMPKIIGMEAAADHAILNASSDH